MKFYIFNYLIHSYSFLTIRTTLVATVFINIFFHCQMSYSAAINMKMEISSEKTCVQNFSGDASSSVNLGDFFYAKAQGVYLIYDAATGQYPQEKAITITTTGCDSIMVRHKIDKFEYLGTIDLKEYCTNCYFNNKQEKQASLVLKSIANGENNENDKFYYFPLALTYSQHVERDETKEPYAFCTNKPIKSIHYTFAGENFSDVIINNYEQLFESMLRGSEANVDLLSGTAYCSTGTPNENKGDNPNFISKEGSLKNASFTLKFKIPTRITTDFWTEDPPVDTEFSGTIVFTSTYI